MSEQQSWKEGLTPEQVADIEQKGEALLDHLEFLDAHPELEPSPEEATTGHVMKRIIEEKDKTD